MARQKGIIKLDGENGAEFGRAGKAGKILRNAIRGLLQNASDARMVSRLTQEMVKVIQEDVTNPRGLRNVIDGEAEFLEGFDFNINGKLGTTIYAPFTAVIDRVAGTLTANLPAFVPQNMIAAPGGTTHFNHQVKCIVRFVLNNVFLHSFQWQVFFDTDRFNFLYIFLEVIDCCYVNTIPGQGNGMPAITTHKIKYFIPGLEAEIIKHEFNFANSKEIRYYIPPYVLIMAIKITVIDICHS